MQLDAKSTATIEAGGSLGRVRPSQAGPSGPVPGALILQASRAAGGYTMPGDAPARWAGVGPPEDPFPPAPDGRLEVPVGAPRVARAAADASQGLLARVLLATESDTTAAAGTFAPLDVEQIPAERVGGVLEGARAVASVCPRDWFLASGVLSCNNGARRFLQPTGDLPPAEMVELLRMASDVVCNLAELRQVAWAADICMPRLPEGSAGAVICCADALRQLHAVGLAGETSAVVTLGRNGSVLGDWRRNQVRFLEFCPLDERAITDTPLGAGDDFLGALVLFTTTWASRGFLNDPCLACTLRATRYVAKKLHLPRESYTVEMTQL